jgi:hypothetical protein
MRHQSAVTAFRHACVAALALVLSALLAVAGPPRGGPPVKVTIQDEKVEVTDPPLPVENRMVIQPSFTNQMSYGLNGEGGKRLTFSQGSARTTFLIDKQSLDPNSIQKPLPPGPRGRQRHGVTQTWVHGDLHITQTIEVVPGKRGEKVKPGTKRLLDTLLIRYVIENKGNKVHEIGTRVRTDTYNVDNDGCLFHAPATFPGKILDGTTLKGPKEVPPVLWSMQRPNLQAPGNVAYWTFKLGSKWEPPSRVVCTWHGAPYGPWDVPANNANGDSDIVFYWDAKPLQPGRKRELAYAYGEGIASSPDSEGRVTLAFGGSFVPDKLFTVTAYVDDPLEGQCLHLELPAGLEYVEGKAVQPVPVPSNEGRSLVLWKARVRQPGKYPIRVRSSNGVTQTRTVTIAPADGARRPASDRPGDGTLRQTGGGS